MAFQGLPQAIAPTSSNSAFLGSSIPYFASATDSFIKNLEEHIGTAVEAALGYLQSELDRAIRIYPEWSPYVGKVRVLWDGSNFQYQFIGTPEEIDAMRNLEYGFDVGASAQSVIRKVSVGSEGTVNQLMSKILTKEAGLG